MSVRWPCCSISWAWRPEGEAGTGILGGQQEVEWDGEDGGGTGWGKAGNRQAQPREWSGDKIWPVYPPFLACVAPIHPLGVPPLISTVHL